MNIEENEKTMPREVKEYLEKIGHGIPKSLEYGLIHAVKHNEVSVVKKIVEFGVKIHDQALFIAFDNASLESAKILIENGCDLNATNEIDAAQDLFETKFFASTRNSYREKYRIHSIVLGKVLG